MYRVVWFLLPVFFCLTPAHAHTSSQSFSSWQVSGLRIEALFAVDARRVTQLSQLYEAQTLPDLLVAHLRETISVTQGSAACPLEAMSPVGQNTTMIRTRLTYLCTDEVSEAGGQVLITSFQSVSATHIHIARFDPADDAPGREFLLTQAQPAFPLSAGKAPGSFSGFVSLGFTHVLSGWDHLAFLAALMLLTGTPRRALIAVTSFTLGHSLTLALAVLGLVSPEERLIEAMIAFTIAMTALEAGLPAQRRTALTGFALMTVVVAALPLGPASEVLFGLMLGLFVFAAGRIGTAGSVRMIPVVAIAFGLVHGAGFAGALTELDLAREQIVWPLLGFNIGVELGQVLALAIIFGAATLARRVLPEQYRPGHAWIALSLFCAGCFWFAERLWT